MGASEFGARHATSRAELHNRGDARGAVWWRLSAGAMDVLASGGACKTVPRRLARAHFGECLWARAGAMGRAGEWRRDRLCRRVEARARGSFGGLLGRASKIAADGDFRRSRRPRYAAPHARVPRIGAEVRGASRGDAGARDGRRRTLLHAPPLADRPLRRGRVWGASPAVMGSGDFCLEFSLRSLRAHAPRNWCTGVRRFGVGTTAPRDSPRRTFCTHLHSLTVLCGAGACGADFLP